MRSAIFSSWRDKGVIRRKQYEAQTNQAMCLNVVTNAVVIWNTVYMQAVLDQLRAEGYPRAGGGSGASLAGAVRTRQSLWQILFSY